MVADPSSGLFSLTFTDSKCLRYTATKNHFLQFCKEGEQPLLSRGSGLQEVLVSFARKDTLLPASLKKCRLGGVEVLSFE